MWHLFWSGHHFVLPLLELTWINCVYAMDCNIYVAVTALITSRIESVVTYVLWLKSKYKSPHANYGSFIIMSNLFLFYLNFFPLLSKSEHSLTLLKWSRWKLVKHVVMIKQHSMLAFKTMTLTDDQWLIQVQDQHQKSNQIHLRRKKKESYDNFIILRQ